MKPKAFDRDVMDLIFGSKINFLQNAVDGLLKARDSNVEDDLVEALEQLEDQITGAFFRESCSFPIPKRLLVRELIRMCPADIDNAGDLDKLGGMRPTLDLLEHPSPRVRLAAFWVVGSTVQSNPKTQELVFNYGAIPTILAPIQATAAGDGAAAVSADPRVLAKNLYALSALLRGCAVCLDDFARRGGAAALTALISRLPPDAAWLPVRRKAAALVGDLVQEEGADAAVARLAAELTGGAGGTPALLALLPSLRSGDRELEVGALAAALPWPSSFSFLLHFLLLLLLLHHWTATARMRVHPLIVSRLAGRRSAAFLLLLPLLRPQHACSPTPLIAPTDLDCVSGDCISDCISGPSDHRPCARTEAPDWLSTCPPHPEQDCGPLTPPNHRPLA
jgi:hypothetical protein